MKRQIESWAESIHERREVSPLVAAMRSEVGQLDRFIHIWAYGSVDHSDEVRAEVASAASGHPGRCRDVLAQENMILRASAYSQLQ